MSAIQTINFLDFIDSTKKIDNPFSRKLYLTTINEDIASGIMIKYDMGNGLAMFARNFIVKDDIILIEESNISAGVFIFNLGEELLFKYKDKKEHVLEKDNFLLALTSDQFYSEVNLKKNKRYVTLSIGMKDELFLNLAKSFENKNEYKKKSKKDSYAILSNDTIDLKQLEILEHFRNVDSSMDLLKSLFIESKIADLAYYSINRIVNLPKKNELNINKNRIASLVRAKEVILKEYHKNISIKDIANKAATNECYLKKDFKLYYGMTVFKMLQNYRMQRAKDLLQSDLGVKEVASKVGYKDYGSFSKTFFKYFSIKPSEYKK